MPAYSKNNSTISDETGTIVEAKKEAKNKPKRPSSLKYSIKNYSIIVIFSITSPTLILSIISTPSVILPKQVCAPSK